MISRVMGVLKNTVSSMKEITSCFCVMFYTHKTKFSVYWRNTLNGRHTVWRMGDLSIHNSFTFSFYLDDNGANTDN